MIWFDLFLFALLFFVFGWIDDAIYWIKGLLRRKETEE